MVENVKSSLHPAQAMEIQRIVEQSAFSVPHTYVPSSYYRFFLPGDAKLGQGVPVDHSGQKAFIYFAAGETDAKCWANPGYMTTLAGSSQMICATVRASRLDLSTSSVIIAFTLKAAAPGAPSFILGNFDSGHRGYYAQVGTDGKLTFGCRNTTNAYNATTSTAVVADGTDHAVLIAVDAKTRSMYLYIDGRLDTISKNFFTNATTADNSYDLAIGSASSTNAGSFAGQWKGFHLLALGSAGLPTNLPNLAKKLYLNPQQPIFDNDIRLPRRRIGLAIVGQSNETGQGTVPSETFWGAPHKDPIAPNGTTRSMWISLVEYLGKRGVWVEVVSTARGSTSLPNNWTGWLRDWYNGVVTMPDALIAANGGIWRVVVAATAYASTVAPTGTSNQTTSDGIQWVYVRPDNGETRGVFAEGDSRFDPTSVTLSNTKQLSPAWTALNALEGCDDKFVIICTGQSDCLMSTRDQFKQAIINITEYFLKRGVKVGIGHSISANQDPAQDVGYLTNTIPGMEDALTYYANDSRVFRAANLRTELGFLGNSNPGEIGLKGDNIHGTDGTMDAAGNLHGRQLYRKVFTDL